MKGEYQNDMTVIQLILYFIIHHAISVIAHVQNLPVSILNPVFTCPIKGIRKRLI